MTMTSKALKKLGQMTNINSICHPMYLAWSGVGSKTTDFPGLQNGVVIVSQSVSVQISKQSQLTLCRHYNQIRGDREGTGVAVSG